MQDFAQPEAVTSAAASASLLAGTDRHISEAMFMVLRYAVARAGLVNSALGVSIACLFLAAFGRLADREMGKTRQGDLKAVASHTYGFLSIIHGSLGAALVALLVLSLWLDRRGDRASLVTGLSISMLFEIAQVVLGILLHRQFAAHLRPALLQRAPTVPRWVMGKEYLAVAAVVLTIAALVLLVRGIRGERSPEYWRAVTWVSRAAALSAFLAFTFGILVAAALIGFVQ